VQLHLYLQVGCRPGRSSRPAWASPPIAARGRTSVRPALAQSVSSQTKSSPLPTTSFLVLLGFGMNHVCAAVASYTAWTLDTCHWMALEKFGKYEARLHFLFGGNSNLRRQRDRGGGPDRRANDEEMSISLGTVFILNYGSRFSSSGDRMALHLSQQTVRMWRRSRSMTPVRRGSCA